MVALFAIYLVALIGAPLGAVLILAAAVTSRRDRPRRAWTVLGIGIALSVPILWALSREFGWSYGYGDAAPDWVRTADRIAETAALVLAIGLVASALSLVLPRPAGKRAGAMAWLGLACCGGALLAITVLSGVNLSL